MAAHDGPVCTTPAIRTPDAARRNGAAAPHLCVVSLQNAQRSASSSRSSPRRASSPIESTRWSTSFRESFPPIVRPSRRVRYRNDKHLVGTDHVDQRIGEPREQEAPDLATGDSDPRPARGAFRDQIESARNLAQEISSEPGANLLIPVAGGSELLRGSRMNSKAYSAVRGVQRRRSRSRTADQSSSFAVPASTSRKRRSIRVRCYV